MKFKPKKLNNKRKLLASLLLVGGVFFELYYHMFKKKKIKNIEVNLIDFLNKEKKEVDEFTHGQESFEKFCSDAGSIFKDYFIPHKGNGHKPKILRPKSLAIIVILMTILKVAATGYLFFVYSPKAQMTEQISSEILNLSNQDRQKNNLGPLSLDPLLSTAAMAKAENMIIFNYFDHVSPDGKKPWDWINRIQYNYILVGENLAMNFSSAKTAHEALMQSPLHKKNILNSKYKDIGLAVVSGKINGENTNVLVELFGTKITQKLADVASQPVTQNAINEITSNVSENKVEVLGDESLANATNTQENKATTSEIFLEDKNISPRISAIASVENEIIFNSEEDSSPNLKLNKSFSSDVYYTVLTNNKSINNAAKFAIYLRYFYFTILGIMIMLLAVNIFVKIKIQHKPVIVQTLVAIIFIAGLLSLRLNILENIFERVVVI